MRPVPNTTGIYEPPLTSEMRCAKAWGKTPSEWFAMGRAERALILGYEIAESEINHWSIEWTISR